MAHNIDKAGFDTTLPRSGLETSSTKGGEDVGEPFVI
jgi:hypothetical protein